VEENLPPKEQAREFLVFYLLTSFWVTPEALTIALACSIESQLTNRVEL
jgi:hypothetical protein